jgi:hypothetical protein
LPENVKNPLKPELIAPEFQAKDIGTMTRQMNRFKKNARTSPDVLKYIEDVQEMFKEHGDEVGGFFPVEPSVPGRTAANQGRMLESSEGIASAAA